ncbi:MAG TPA: serine/threonine-protein kinase [Myxococcales bacterium]|nr:serine/threonine-protein kinase [Myxococcales bacterium]
MLAAGTPIGKYVVRRKIAEGGMAEIYLCAVKGPEGFSKDVVIKRIRSFLAGDQSFVQMFIAEARVASRLNHANLVQIFDFDKHEDTYYLAMEYVRGHSLWDVRKRSKELMQPMPPTLVAHVGAEVAKGLGHAHRLSEKGKSLNLVHRDVTPHNVLLSFDGAVKLTDFGVAKHSASSTAAGVLKGKFAYMSPEQARGDPLDSRTDLFALGIVLWEMLTGGRLFDGDSDVAVLRAVQSSAIAPPSRLNPDVPEALSAIVMKALERDPAQRFQSAPELDRALAGFVLSNARSVDDTNLAGYLHLLYAEELFQEAQREGRGSGPPSLELGAPAVEEVRPREPTALMDKGAAPVSPAELAAPASPVSPDEDAHGSTYVVDRSRPQAPERSGGPSAATEPEAASPPKVIADLSALQRARSGPRPAPPVPPPTMTIPAVRRRAPLSVGMRRGLIAAGLLAMGIAAAGVTVAVSRSLERTTGTPAPPPPAPAATPSPDSTAAAGPPATGEPAPRPPSTDSTAAAPPPPPPASGKAPAGAAPPQPSAPVVPAAAASNEANLGTLLVRVRPYASVSIDGKRRKDAQGSATFKLPAGTHTLRLEHPRGSKEQQVTIDAGKVTVVDQSFVGH